jgi:proteasome-associated ATPase
MNHLEEKIQILEKKIAAYEEAIEEVMQQPISTGEILSDPYEFAGRTYYRAKVNGQDAVIRYNPESKGLLSKNKKLKIGSKVAVIGAKIDSVLPDELAPKEEAPQFSLIDWDQIGGLNSQVSTIRKAVEGPMQHAALYETMGIRPVSGILLYGPPGCGKTLVAKAIASTVLRATSVPKQAFTYLKGGEMLSPYVGMAENRIVEIFSNARNYMEKSGSPAVIFIDEAEAILPQRGSRRSSDVDTTIVPTFLSEMDGFQDLRPIVILATNYPSNLDEAILRDGRMDLKIEIHRPTKEDAVEIFAIHLRGKSCKLDPKDLADHLFMTPQAQRVSGAMIENLVARSAEKAIHRAIDAGSKKAEISLEDFTRTMLEIK